MWLVVSGLPAGPAAVTAVLSSAVSVLNCLQFCTRYLPRLFKFVVVIVIPPVLDYKAVLKLPISDGV